jgi:hypothetical protein
MSSRTPDGGYQPTFASNFMLDGFDFDEDYGEGVLTGRKDTTTSRTTGMAAPPRSQNGLAGLPDGFVNGEREAALDDDVFAGSTGTDVGDLSGLVKQANHITDLAWLELAEQDPDRLPQQHNDKALQGVVEAWGTNHRTDGVEVIPNVVVPPQPRSQVAWLPGDQYREIVASAMRKAAFGVPFTNIVMDVASHLGPALQHVHTDPQLQKLASAIRFVRAEYGVVGQVFLRDSAFPGLLSGKWDQEIRRRCASAKYWLTRPGSKLSAYQNYLGKQVVTEIPWTQALDHYRPTLEASGRRLASGDPKTVLIAAMRQEVQKKDREATYVPHSPQAQEQHLALKKAWEALVTAPLPTREIIQKDTVRVSLEQARAKLGSWVEARMLTPEEARKVMASGLAPADMIRTAAIRVATHQKRVGYMGEGIGARVRTTVPTGMDAFMADAESSRLASEKEAREAADVVGRKEAQERAERVIDESIRQGSYQGDGVGASVYAGQPRKLGTGVVEVSMEKVAATVQGWVKARALTEEQGKYLLSRKATGSEIIQMGTDLIARAKKATYEGTGVGVKTLTGTPQRTPQVQAMDPKVSQVLRYASQQMNEGAAGNDLDVLLASRFSQDYLKNAGASLVQIRRKHEGLAGHVYVATDAYASPTGTSGCDKGALIHRANQIKAALQMERCATCAANSGGSCQKYNKVLVASAPVADPGEYQREAIRLANADDSERVAAMFNAYDPGEFGLQNDALDSFDYSNLPDGKTLSDVLFGGLTLPEE